MTLPVGAQQHTETAPGGGLGRLLASTGVSLTGQGMVAAATPLLAATLTRDPLGVSLVTVATYAAWLVIGLPAGVLVDRWPRRMTMVVSDLVRAALLGLLATLVFNHSMSLPVLVAVVFLMGAAACFFDPAAQAAIPQLVGRETGALATANSRLWMLDVLGRSLIGPPAGAALFAVAASIPFGVNALAFLVSALLLAGLGSLRVSHPTDGHPKLRDSLTRGLRYLWKHPELRALTLGMGSFNLAYNTAFAILVLYAQIILGLSDRGFGVLLACQAVGGLAGGWAAPRIARAWSARVVYAAGLAVLALGWLLIATLHNAVIAGLGLVSIGVASMVVTVVGGTARQSLTPDELLGRVSSATRVVGIGSAALGALVGGAIGRATTLPLAVLSAAVMATVAAAAFGATRNRPPQVTSQDA